MADQVVKWGRTSSCAAKLAKGIMGILATDITTDISVRKGFAVVGDCHRCGECDQERDHLIRDDDLPWLRVTSATPVACQIDGDYLGLRDTMTFTAVPDALGVVAPPAKTPPDLH